MLNIQDVRLEQTRVYQDIEEKVRGKELRDFVLELLTTTLGDVPETAAAKIETLSLDKVRSLGKSVLNFRALEDLEQWLADQS
jgi:predicted transposase YdaD